MIGILGSGPHESARTDSAPSIDLVAPHGTSRVEESSQGHSPGVEPLELRNLLAATLIDGPIALISEAGPNDTLNLSQDIGNVGVMPGVAVAGLIGDGLAGPADVDWYSFTLDRPASVALSVVGSGGNPSLKSVLGLYNNDPSNFQDWYNPLGHRLLAQDDGGTHGGNPSIGRDLGPGTYYVAISGAGNLDFHPFIAGSGHEGDTGSYHFLMTAAEIGTGVDGPIVLAADPSPDAVLASSPFVIRLGLSGPLDPSANLSQETVRLVFNPIGAFGDGQDQDVSLLGIYSSPEANELQLTLLGSPWAPGSTRSSSREATGRRAARTSPWPGRSPRRSTSPASRGIRGRAPRPTTPRARPTRSATSPAATSSASPARSETIPSTGPSPVSLRAMTSTCTTSASPAPAAMRSSPRSSPDASARRSTRE